MVIVFAVTVELDIRVFMQSSCPVRLRCEINTCTMKLNIKPLDRFQSWTVISEEEPVAYGRIRIRHFLCECKCGARSVLPLTNLRSGRSSQCKKCVTGCVREEEVAIAICEAVRKGKTHNEVAQMFGISHHTVWNIVHGRVWKSLKRHGWNVDPS